MIELFIHALLFFILLFLNYIFKPGYPNRINYIQFLKRGATLEQIRNYYFFIYKGYSSYIIIEVKCLKTRYSYVCI